MEFNHPTGGQPKTIVILGCGPSKADYVELMANVKAEKPHVDEVWGVNAIGNVLNVDMSFIMDDYAICKGRLPALCRYMETATKPIIVPTVRKECPTAVEYPLSEVLSQPGARELFNHTIPYMIAYAMMIGVKQILMFGVDYVAASAPYDPRDTSEFRARYCGATSYWLGLAAGRGVDVIVTPNSPLLETDVPDLGRFYGYLIKPVIRREGE